MPPPDTPNRPRVIALGVEIVGFLRGCVFCRFALLSVSIGRTKPTARERRHDANLTAIDAPTCRVSISPFLTRGLRTPSWQGGS